MEIIPLGTENLAEAAGLFVDHFKQLRKTVPDLPERMGNLQDVVQKLERLLSFSSGLAAMQDGRLLGYLSWFIVDGFRETERRGAYCPEWGHAAAQNEKPSIYRALYRVAAGQWATAGCQVHALSLLAHDQQAIDAWFWNGFGLTVVDAIRSIHPLGISLPVQWTIRKARVEDLTTLISLDKEHVRHYQDPPVFMVPPPYPDETGWSSFLNAEPNSVWIGMDGDFPIGFIKFEQQSSGGVAIVESETTIAITGAYVRPPYRSQGIATALLDAALQYYSNQGFERCSVDFEAFNPEAASFWPRYFQPVCFSVTRMPEVVNTLQA